MNEPVVSSWAEYKILCADGEERHRPTYVSSMPNASDTLDKAEANNSCGPHALYQRIVERLDHPWTKNLIPDPSDAAKESLTRSVQKFACPKCSAAAKEVCRDMRKGAFAGRPTNWPHQDRMDMYLAWMGGDNDGLG